ncbi:MAG TPA: alpha/beta fold hydrolase [Dehalococcoidia bacterium]
MPTFNSDGVTIRYEVAGQGPPVVLVHGFASSLRGNWQATGWFDRLTAAGRQVIALDCRGHGESEKLYDPAAYDHNVMADDVVRLMDHLGVERADLMGYSMGGMISLNLLIRHQDRFRSVVLAGIGGAVLGYGRPRNNETIARALESGDPSAMADATARGFRAFAERSGNDMQALAACMRRPRPTYDPAALAGVRIPVLVVVGEQDDLAFASADKLAAAIPGARFVTIPGKDHLTAVPDERYKQAVLEFLAAQAPA